MGIGLKKSYWSSSSYHPHTVAHLCNQFNHVFAVLFSISHFARNNFYQTRPAIKLLLQRNCKIFKGNRFQWFPVARGSALNPKAQPPHYKFLALLHLASSQYWKCKCVASNFFLNHKYKKVDASKSSSQN